MKNHPDILNEQNTLNNILKYAKKEKTRLQTAEDDQAQEVKKLIIESGGIYSMDLDISKRIYSMSVRLLSNINKTMDNPYFTRVDFMNEEEEVEKLYIGKWGVIDPKTQKPVIIDWRSPIANLYYTHQVGPANYQTPNGQVNGEIILKRLFEIEKAKIINIVEADIISEGDYLNDVLSDHADARLKDIVTTIQSEQNAVLRSNHRAPLIVQGVAGSGKTTIALHRIMWMLYTFQDTMQPSNIMVIAPSPIFLDYISAVLPDMGVEDVIQETFYGLACRLCKTKLYKVDDANILLNLLDTNIDQSVKETLINYSRFKGSLKFKEFLLEYINLLPGIILPSQGLYLGNKQVLSAKKILDLFTIELSPFNYAARVKQLKKALSNIYKAFVIQEKNALEQKVKKRANYLRESIKKDIQKRQEIMLKLYSARDKKIAVIDNYAKVAVNEYIKMIKVPKLLDCYVHFLSEFMPAEQNDELLSAWNISRKIIIDNLSKKTMETSDIPPLLIIQKELFGHSERLNIHHTVLDEAQDFSPFMFDTLKSFTHNNSFTIVGDLTQGIYAYQGVQDWLDMKNEVFDETATYHELVTSYRNTVEIMNLAESCAMRHSKNRTPAKPVLRHGMKPKLIKSNTIALAIIDEINEHKANKMKTIAIIDKMPDDCKKLYKMLKKHLPEIKYLDDKETSYTGGIMVMPAYLCKGLEFDCVIIANGEDENFSDDLLHCRVMYVCLTRPIQSLSIYYTHNHSRLIDENLCETITKM